MRRLIVIALAVFVLHASAATPPDDREIVHVLNRIAFGARPGDVERVRAIGVERYINEQLRGDEGETEEGRERDGGATEEGRGQIVRALAEHKLVRAIRSERQLQEVLADFWFNHFNVDARKGPVRLMVADYERDAIRPHVLGRFRDLLGATAASPAMLFYLDNWMSNVRRGVNENYARELMELHTLGVDGGYTQHDVTEVARAFTGWTIDRPRDGGPFVFRPLFHDDGEKMVLGHRITAGGGMRDGEKVLDILAAHPSTARFVAAKLVRHFVSDAPPPALVARAAARFRDTDGNLREVMRTILTSREFLSPDDRSKVKTPFEFVVSAVRALGADVEVRTLVRALQQLGMPLYQCQPPTGYKDTADAWVNAGALVARMNFALQLARDDADVALSIGGPDFQRK